MSRTKYIAALAAIMILVQIICIGVSSAPVSDVSDTPPIVEGCTAYYLYNFENDRVLASVGCDEVVYPASAVKLMTGIIAVEELGGDLERKITVTNEMIKNCVGNNLGFKAGEIVTVKDMLYACLVGGANDAALILASTVSENEKTFVDLMNTKASLIGAFDTHYTNPTGIHDPAMVTTGTDTAIIAKYAHSLPLLREIVATPKYVMEKTNMTDFRNIYSRNCLISKYYDTYNTPYRYEGAIGMNAGYTTASGAVVVATAENKDGDLSYLAVLMGGSMENGENASYAGAVTLFNWAFAAYDYLDILSTEKVICEVPVSLSSAVDHVTLVPQNALTAYLPTSTDIEAEVEYSYTLDVESLSAPVKMGQRAGMVTVVFGGEVIGSSPLITTVDVERSELLYTLAQIEEFTKSKFFIGTVVSAVVLSVGYVLLKARIRTKSSDF